MGFLWALCGAFLGSLWGSYGLSVGHSWGPCGVPAGSLWGPIYSPPPLFQPKVTWLKNSVEIGADPKFLSRHGLGVLSLLIRRPGPFDGGTYGCRAVNEMGEATTECRLDVRGEIWGWGC